MILTPHSQSVSIVESFASLMSVIPDAANTSSVDTVEAGHVGNAVAEDQAACTSANRRTPAVAVGTDIVERTIVVAVAAGNKL